jgi:hypothetical protein
VIARVASSTWTLGAIVFALTWGGGIAELIPPNIDNSFHAGLQMAAARELSFGPDILVTYGPLGFLKSNLIFEPWPARLAGIYGIALHLSLSLSLVWAARRNFGAVLGFAIALVAAVLARGDLTLIAVRDDAAVVVVAFIWCVAALSDGSPDWTRRLLVWGGGPFAAIELLAKVNPGVLVLAIVAIAVLAIERNRLRNLAILSGGFAATALALWLISGQALGDVWTFAGGTLQIVAGYSAGASIDYGGRGYDYFLAGLLLAAIAAAAWLSTRALDPRRRIATLAITAIVAFTAVKGGFVAHDIFHMGAFYATMLGVLIAFPLPRLAPVRYTALGATVAAAAMGFTTTQAGDPRTDNPGYPMVNPIGNLAHGAETVITLASGRLEDEIDERRERAIATYDIDPGTLAELRGHSVHVDPSEAAAAWAYGLDWRPLPVFQPYIAWTPELDRRNAEALADPDGPQRVLRQNLDALGRYPAYESPETMLTMLCNFEAVRTTESWQVLERVPDRCGEPRLLSSGPAAVAVPIDVPRAGRDEVVFARVSGLGIAGLERLRSLLLRAPARQVAFSDDPRLWTFTAANAEQGLLLRAPTSVDFPEPLALAPNADQVSFLIGGTGADRTLIVDFYAMSVSARRPE